MPQPAQSLYTDLKIGLLVDQNDAALLGESWAISITCFDASRKQKLSWTMGINKLSRRQNGNNADGNSVADDSSNNRKYNVSL